MTSQPLRGGRIASVEPGPAARAGLRAGDTVLEVNGQPVRDVLDWWWLTADAPFTVTVNRNGERLPIALAETTSEPLGVSFADVLFEPIRECENACAFCFVAGLPDGLRPALYVRDDDFRLSFLNGNFVTLTNLTDEDVARIKLQRLSPLHVSVHAVDPDVRSALMCVTVEDRALEYLDELVSAGIEVHVQIVLVSGINDGGVLDETLTYLTRRPGVLSVGVVPMGFTRHQTRWTSSWTPETAVTVVGQLTVWQNRLRPERGVAWVYPADEFYLLAGLPVPPAAHYDGFPQYENGIGMVASFAEEFRESASGGGGIAKWLHRADRRSAHRSTARSTRARAQVTATLLTGELFAPVVRALLDEAGWRNVRVLAVRNALLGGNVSVTGLLGGHDIVDAVVTDGSRGAYLLPDVVVNSDGLLLDDVPASDLPGLARANVCIVGRDAKSLIDALSKR